MWGEPASDSVFVLCYVIVVGLRVKWYTLCEVYSISYVSMSNHL
jgi:hypothetical protein